ncbi:MAG: ArsR family transcriptional regulator [Spirochaetes bacterium]|nr:ArsR family transcriptional regulator [Spirochaetota bacterium]
MLIDEIITSKTRIKLLLKFFINPGTISYLRELAGEFGESTNSVRLELNSLTNAKILKRGKNGNTIAYRANVDHPLFKEIRSIILKSIGIDKVINSIIDNIGSPLLIILTGDYAKGIDSGIIDIVIVGNTDKSKLDEYIASVESKIDRKVRCLLLVEDEFNKLKDKLKKDGMLILWEAD